MFDDCLCVALACAASIAVGVAKQAIKIRGNYLLNLAKVYTNNNKDMKRDAYLMLKEILKPLFYPPAKHIYKLITSEPYRRYYLLEYRLRGAPRLTECYTRVYGWDISIPDSASFLSNYKEIFVEQIYAFVSNNPCPKILDIGAHIGLSVLFFKHCYPQAQITAFEADPRIFAYLKKNVHGNGYTDVQLINKAVWHENAALKFSPDGADGGYVALKEGADLIGIDAINIAEFLKEKQFDLLKMDIEGAEGYVIPACKDCLQNIKFIFVEYHSITGQKQDLDQIVNTLSEANFRIHIHCVMSHKSPFIRLNTSSRFDLQLNIFGWRES